MKRNILLIIMICLVAAGCGKGEQTPYSENTQTPVNQQQIATFDLQSKCAEASKKFYTESGYKLDENNTYTNHWNQKLGRCFIEIESSTVSGGDLLNSKYLFDSLEGKTFGSFIVNRDKPIEFQKPLYCAIMPKGDPKDSQFCNSESEFDDAMTPFMNE